MFPGDLMRSPVADYFPESHCKPLYRGKEHNMETLKIKGMSCQHCVGSVKKALESLPGISQVTVDLEAGQATFLNNSVDRQQLRAAITKIGFDPGE
jgi:copper chaperone